MNHKTNIHRTMLAVAVVLLAVTPQSAWAYAGPGSGLTVIGAALAFVGGVLLAIVGFVWYPIKRLLRGKASRKKSSATADTVTH
jgi:hypothetical protein